MKRRKLKKKPIIIAISILLVILIVIFKTISTIMYHRTYDYKLSQLNYSKSEIENIKKLNSSTIDSMLTKKKIKDINKYLKEKYFLEKNLYKYIKYHNENEDKKMSDVIAIVNVGANNKPYEKTKSADTSKGELMLVNKYNYLDKDFAPSDVIDAPIRFAFDDNKTTELVFNNFKNMALAASDENLTLIINSGYRDYAYQEALYKKYEVRDGSEKADLYAARPGYSEHQTGLAIDIITYGSNGDDFDTTEEFKWLNDNAHKYGFILRYPKDKEEITGYDYESWHFRYVGESVATKIKKLGITFDEYYAYYIEGK